MRPTDRRELGRTGVSVTQLGLGGAPLGSMRSIISDDAATATLRAAWDAGVRYFDTAPWYGRGLSERRFGNFLKDQDRDQFVISTKVGRLLRPPADPAHFEPAPWAGSLPFDVAFDYSYTGIMRSFEDCLQRLGLPSIDLLLIHDLDPGYHHPAEVLDGHWRQLTTSGWRALAELKGANVIKGIGAGINYTGLIPRFLNHFPMDFFLVASPYTLLDQGALETDLPLCVERGVGVVIGAVFNSGILATGPVGHAQYNYGDADRAVLDKAARLQAASKSYGISLRAAALQFPLAHSAVAAVIPGAFAPEHVIENARAFEEVIPPEFWSQLKAEGLLAGGVPTPEGVITR